MRSDVYTYFLAPNQVNVLIKSDWLWQDQNIWLYQQYKH